ncbi:MAG: hypothetical protein WAS36_03130 [Candidatus Saccharimonadales bacterium]
MHKNILGFVQQAPLMAVLILGIITGLAISINSKNTDSIKSEFINTETKINKLGDDILVEHANAQHQKRSFCYYTSTINKSDDRVCSVKYEILFENTNEAQVIQIFESAVTKAQGLYVVTTIDSATVDSIKSAELSEPHTATLEYLGSGKMPPLYCDMRVNHRAEIQLKYNEQRPSWKIPKNSGLLTIECYGKAKADYYTHVNVISAGT